MRKDILKFLATGCGCRLILPLRGLPAEWAVARMDVANVVSFCTSALANIAMSDAVDRLPCDGSRNRYRFPWTVGPPILSRGPVRSGRRA